MSNTIRYKFIFLSMLILLSLVVSIPSLFKSYPPWLGKFLPTEGMRLGLDLQGGMQLILKVDIPRAEQNRLEISIHDLTDALRNSHIRIDKVQTLGQNQMRVYFPELSTTAPLQQVLEEQFPDLSMLSSDLEQGGGYADIGLKPKEVQAIQENAVAQSLEIIRNRIDQFGVTEPVIVRQGSDEIVVQLPGLKDPGRAIELIGKTAELVFKLMDDETRLNLSELISEAVRSGKLKGNYSNEDLNRALAGQIPLDDEIYLLKEVDEVSGTTFKVPILVKKRIMMTGEAIKTAHVQIGGPFNRPFVALTLNARGARLFDEVTRENVGRRLAIILDDVAQSAPVIKEQIAGGRAEITGNFSPEEANDLAIVLRAGALPAPVDIVQNLTVGPSLGQDSIRKGVAAAILGTILVVCFMVTYYRLSGVIANLALLLNLILMVAALSLFQATLTLPGIAGIILSIGMAVDSNVLVFERMREEFNLGKPIKSGVDAGYDKALWTIIDSHITTLITAFALFLFGTGPIKGFAVTLSLGVIFNLFTVLFGTKVVYDYLNLKHRIKRIRFLQIIETPGIDFIGLRKIAFGFSTALVLLGVIGSVQVFRGKANLGVDFTGGAVIQFKADADFQMADVRKALSLHGIQDYELQRAPQERILIVRTKGAQTSVGTMSDKVASILSQEFPQNHFSIERVAEIGSSVSKALQQAALIAITISLAGIIIYLAWRFEFRFGIAATIATFHDVLAVLGVFFLLGREITLLVVTALLTLAGYSLTDTVVVFDRIRENLGKRTKKDLGELINESINEVLSRTIITSSTVLFVLLALLLLGGAVLHDFALALTFGVIVGTYSSVFVASPIVYIWPTSKRPRREAAVAKGRT
jgi:SecD/SecF fusion protein